MTPEHFAAKFCLTPTPDDKRQHHTEFKPDELSKVAAVLVPVVKRPSGLTILFTKRASHLRHHPRQISFPGGKKDLEDSSLTATAIRETFEEIGIGAEYITPLGWLPEHHTITNFSVFPLVALVEQKIELDINQDEVADVFEFPLNHFLQRNNHFTLHPHRQGQTHAVHFMPVGDKVIWGATAAILDKLALHLSNEN